MTNAQNTVVADASAEYLGYANVFETVLPTVEHLFLDLDGELQT